jgi:hypothetical protein
LSTEILKACFHTQISTHSVTLSLNEKSGDSNRGAAMQEKADQILCPAFSKQWGIRAVRAKTAPLASHLKKKTFIQESRKNLPKRFFIMFLTDIFIVLNKNLILFHSRVVKKLLRVCQKFVKKLNLRRKCRKIA